jgi:5-methylcytosine-specific restriction protein A
VCSARPMTQVHHRRPRGKGGTWLASSRSPANLLAVCDQCHLRIESERTWAFEQGLLLLPSGDAAERPVFLRHLYGTGWWLLSDDGLITMTDAPYIPA